MPNDVNTTYFADAIEIESFKGAPIGPVTTLNPLNIHVLPPEKRIESVFWHSTPVELLLRFRLTEGIQQR